MLQNCSITIVVRNIAYFEKPNFSAYYTAGLLFLYLNLPFVAQCVLTPVMARYYFD